MESQILKNPNDEIQLNAKLDNANAELKVAELQKRIAHLELQILQNPNHEIQLNAKLEKAKSELTSLQNKATNVTNREKDDKYVMIILSMLI